MKVLIVDDDLSVRKSLKKQVESLDHQIVTAADGLSTSCCTKQPALIQRLVPYRGAPTAWPDGTGGGRRGGFPTLEPCPMPADNHLFYSMLAVFAQGWRPVLPTSSRRRITMVRPAGPMFFCAPA